MTRTFKKNAGFTLIEMIIYMALFSLLMGSVFVIAFQLIEGTGKLNTKNTTQDEGNFIMRKIGFALNGVDTITTPSSGNSPTLVITKYSGNKITLQQNGTAIEMKETGFGNTFIPITTPNVKVAPGSLDFKYETLGGITTTFVMDGIPFTTTKYLRK